MGCCGGVLMVWNIRAHYEYSFALRNVSSGEIVCSAILPRTGNLLPRVSVVHFESTNEDVYWP